MVRPAQQVHQDRHRSVRSDVPWWCSSSTRRTEARTSDLDIGFQDPACRLSGGCCWQTSRAITSVMLSPACLREHFRRYIVVLTEIVLELIASVGHLCVGEDSVDAGAARVPHPWRAQNFAPQVRARYTECGDAPANPTTIQGECPRAGLERQEIRAPPNQRAAACQFRGLSRGSQ